MVDVYENDNDDKDDNVDGNGVDDDAFEPRHC